MIGKSVREVYGWLGVLRVSEFYKEIIIIYNIVYK